MSISSTIPSCKLVTVGDGAVGKTALLSSYTTNTVSNDYAPTVFDTKNAMTTMNGKPVAMCLYDSAGQEDYDQLRCLSYPQTDCFLLCFSLVNDVSFQNIASKWVPELRKHCPDVPILLIGTKLDLRNDFAMGSCNVANDLSRRGLNTVSTEQGQKLAKDINAVGYVECSSISQEGLAHVFDEALVAWVAYKEMKRKKFKKEQNCCSIM